MAADDSTQIYVGAEPVSAANPVPVTGTITATGGLTDAQLRATPVKVDDDATQVLLTAIDGHVDGVAAALNITLSALRDAILGASSRTLTDLYGILDGLEGSVDGLETLLAAATPAGENHIGEVGGKLAIIAATWGGVAELTRPSDSTPYTAKDAVSDSTSAPNVATFTNLARVNAGTGYIVGARLMTDQKTNVSRFRLHLFHTTPTAINDNAVQTLLYANKAKRIGYIDLPPMSTEDSSTSDSAESYNFDVRLPFAADGGARTIFGLLETIDAFTPASGQKFYLELAADLN